MKSKVVVTNPLASAELTLPRCVVKWLAKAKRKGKLSRYHARVLFVLLLALLRTSSFITTGTIFILIAVISRSSLKDVPELVGNYLSGELSDWRYQLTYRHLIEEWQQEILSAGSNARVIRAHMANSKLLIDSAWFSCKEWFMQRTRTAGVFQRR